MEQAGALVTDKRRNIKIEIFRIVCMLMVVMLHYLENGGALYNSQVNNLTYIISWVLEAFCIVAVNCYVLISGYFLVKNPFKIKRIVTLWAQVLFYTILISIVLWISGLIHFTLRDLIFTVLPTLTNEYWFATTYIVLYFLMPFLNIAIKALTKKQMKFLILTMIAIFSVWNTLLPFATTLDLTKGYGIIWFICLYFIAAYLRLYYTPTYKNKRFLVFYFIISLIIAASKFALVYITNKLGVGEKYTFDFYEYDSITVLLSSLCLFLFFINSKRKTERTHKFILSVSAATFGVYLIHEQFLFRNVLWNDILKVNVLYTAPLFILESFAVVVAVYIVCTAIEMLRKVIFYRLENGALIDKICHKINFGKIFDSE